MKYNKSAAETLKDVLSEKLELLQSCEDGRSFLYNSSKLIEKIRSDTMLKDFIYELEVKNKERREEIIFKTFQVAEQEFVFRYTLPTSTFSYRKNLLKIRVMINKSRDSSTYSPIGEAINHFQWVGFPPSTPKDIINASPLSKFREEFPSLGSNGYLKSNLTQAYVEADPIFLWNQLQTFEEGLNLTSSSCSGLEYFLKKPLLKGKWEKIGFTNWKNAFETSHRINIFLTYCSILPGIIHNLPRTETSNYCPFTPGQYLVTRKHITQCFERLLHLINIHLLENSQEFEEEDTSPITERERYKKRAVEILKELFKKHPLFTIGQIISEYRKIKDAPFYVDKYLRDIIRTLDLDKRTHKPRGPGKKSMRITCLSTSKKVTKKK